MNYLILYLDSKFYPRIPRSIPGFKVLSQNSRIKTKDSCIKFQNSCWNLGFWGQYLGFMLEPRIHVLRIILGCKHEFYDFIPGFQVLSQNSRIKTQVSCIKLQNSSWYLELFDFIPGFQVLSNNSKICGFYVLSQNLYSKFYPRILGLKPRIHV